MRDIKFRAWHINDKEMLGHKDACLIPLFTPSFRYRDGETVLMQFTGLKDKSGVEVYEGDVVKYLTHTTHVFWSPQDFGFVHYNEVIGGYAGLSFFIGYKDFEVIGNIHQHPKLLEKK